MPRSPALVPPPAEATTVPATRPFGPASGGRPYLGGPHPKGPNRGGPRPGRSGAVVAALAATVLGGAVVVALYVAAVLDPSGRALDQSVMRAAMRAGSGLRGELLAALDLVSVPTVAVAVAVLGGVALLRGRRDRAVSVVAVVGGSQLVTQALKAFLPRPGADTNSLPSGHVTLVASLAVALVLVLPRALRPLAAVLGAALVAGAGTATMITGWHRPSDVVAAVAVVGAVSGLVAAGRLLSGRPRVRAALSPAPPRPRSA